MKTLRFISIALAGALLVLSACKKDSGKEPEGPSAGTVTDVCGNTYLVVKIGIQYWMAENLRCDKYDTKSEAYNASWLTDNTLPTTVNNNVYTPYYTNASDRSKWNTAQCAKNLTDAQVAKLGYLYNWAAAVGVEDGKKQKDALSGKRQGICPNGWHLPSKDECQLIVNYIEEVEDKGLDTAGKHLKTTSGWYNGGNGLDTYSFAALPAGVANGKTVGYVGYVSNFWSSTMNVSDINAYNYYIKYNYSYLNIENISKYYGQNVRCIRD